MTGFKKIVAVGIMATFIVCFGCLISRKDYYIRSRPKVPEPKLGRVYPLQEHYVVVYVTRGEETEIQFLFFGSIALFVILGGYLYFVDPFNQVGRKE